MKTTLLVLTLSLFLSIQGKTQTTETEYNYITKGLKTTIEQGLDLKSGYEMIEISNFSNLQNKATLFKLNKNKETVALVIIINSEGGKFLCIPQKNSEQKIINQCYYDFRDKLTPDEKAIAFYALALAGQQE